MKKTLLTMAVACALGTSFSALGDDQVAPGDVTTAATGGAQSGGDASEAINEASSSYNSTLNQSGNIDFKDVANDVNTDNKTTIQDDGNVIHAQRADQAVAASDLNATISGNIMVQDGVSGLSGLGALGNTQAGVTRRSSNDIASAFSGAAGIAVVSQSTGNMGSLQQSTVVQSNLKIN